MEPMDYWQCFLETGAPEYYLLYQNARKGSEGYVYDDPGHRAPGHGLQ